MPTVSLLDTSLLNTRECATIPAVFDDGEPEHGDEDTIVSPKSDINLQWRPKRAYSSARSVGKFDAEVDSLRLALRAELRTELSTLKEDLRQLIGEMLHKGDTSANADKPWDKRRSNPDSIKRNESAEFSAAETYRKNSMLSTSSLNSKMNSNVVEARAAYSCTRTEQERMFDAVLENKLDMVQQSLEAGADPNSILATYTKPGSSRDYLDCSLLAVAVLGSHIDMVRLLMEYDADIDSRYGFLAGSLSMRWSGSAIFAAIPSGSLNMLRDLLELQADPHDVSSNQANLVWQSSYFGHIHLLNHLLSLKVDCNLAGHSQDFEEVSYTPMHIAAMKDNENVIDSLISAKAKLDVANEEGKSPLICAMLKERVVATRMLVAAGANLFCSHEPHFGDFLRPVDILMQKSNPLLFRAAAIGLQHQEKQVRMCSVEDVLAFMSSPLAKTEILKALFKRRPLRYWNKDHGVVEVKTAYLRCHELLHDGNMQFINVATSSYEYQDLDRLVKRRLEPPDIITSFLHCLTPQTPRQAGQMTAIGYKRAATGIQLFEALVPDFHEDLRIIRAIAEASVYDNFFLLKSCQAILQTAWQHVWFYTIFELSMQSSLLVVFVLMAVHMSNTSTCWFTPGECGATQFEDEFRSIAICGAPFWFLLCVQEILIGASYRGLHTRREWVFSRWTVRAVYKNTISAINGAILWSIICTRVSGLSYFSFRVAFAIACVCRWSDTIYCLTPIRRFGFPVMPIFYTLRDIGVIAVVFFLYVLAFSTALCALSLRDEHFIDAALNVFSFGATAEPQFLQHAAFAQELGATKIKERVVRVLFIISVFVVNIVLMNCFIGAMCSSYKVGATNRQKLYQKRLASAVCKHLATRRSIGNLYSLLRRPKTPEPAHLWYACELEG